MVLSCTLLHALMLGTHMSLRNASVRPQHDSCAAACCFLFTRTTLARVARECTPLGRGTRPATHSLLLLNVLFGEESGKGGHDAGGHRAYAP